MRNYVAHGCIDCGKIRLVQTRHGEPRNPRCKSCSKIGANHPQFGKYGSESAHWKGGQTVDNRGYIFIYKPDHPRADAKGYIKRAILVLELKLRRPLREGYDAHHINEIKGDDSPDNLEENRHDIHAKLHSNIRTRTNGKYSTKNKKGEMNQ